MSSAQIDTAVSLALHLPAEIRNEIYELILTQPGNIIKFDGRKIAEAESSIKSQEGEAKVSKEPPVMTENQLQYVCKQLRHETHWLQTKLNPTIIIHNSINDKVSATKQLVHLLQMVPAEKREWTQIVEVYSGVVKSTEYRKMDWYPTFDSKETLIALVNACKLNRHITVKV